MSARQTYRITALAGAWIAGYRRPVGPTILLTPDEAEYDLRVGTIEPTSPPPPPPTPTRLLLQEGDFLRTFRGTSERNIEVEALEGFLTRADSVLAEYIALRADEIGVAIAAAVERQMAGKAPRLSPDFQGTPTAPTAAAGTSSDQLATLAFVAQAIAALDLASASTRSAGDFAAAAHGHKMSAIEGLLSALDAKAPLVSPTFTGFPMAPSAPLGSNDARIANTNFVAITAALKANLVSPNFAGVPAVPTAAAGTNTTQAASTAFVTAAVLGLRDALVNGSGAALDTFKELADALGSDPDFATTISIALGNRLRFDAAQTLTAVQVTQALTNLGVSFASLRSFLTATTAAAARQQIGLGSTDSVEFFALYINGGVPWTSATAPGSIAADASYAIQRFPSGEAIIKGTSVVTLNASGRALINVGLTAAVGTWLGMATNGDFGVSKAQAIPGLNTSTGFTVEFQAAANATVRVNWLVWGRWK